jgi:hypothetical protein
VRSKVQLFQRFPFRWTIFWLLIPNFVIILMWPVGGPPMRAPLLIFGALALMISQVPSRIARTAALAVLMLWHFVIYLASMFSIPTLNFGMFLQFLSDIRPLRAPEYVMGGIVFLATLVTAVVGAPKVARFDHFFQFGWAILGVLVFANADQLVTSRSSASYQTQAHAPFSSAVRQANLAPEPAAQRHVVVIVVEALGLPTAPEEKRLFEAAWHRPEWGRRYELRFGNTPFFGSTTSGELRELCGQWSDHVRFDFDHAHCLPKRFRKAGYVTTAMHSFAGALFDRARWYPKLGFDRIEFAQDLFRQGAARCDGVFPGACDTDVPAIIGRRLASARDSQFIYWLTLNSHLPVMAEKDGRCAVGAPAWNENFPRVCRMFQKHRQLADAIDRMVMSPGLPPTDILIVGDHKPPFFDRGSRARFDATHVPWIYLRARQPLKAPLSRGRSTVAGGTAFPTSQKFETTHAALSHRPSR